MEILENDSHEALDFNENRNTNQDTISIPVIQETVKINKSQVETGRIKISKKVNEETQVVEIPLEHEEIEVETIDVNQYVDTIPEPVRYEGDTMVIPVLKEVSVVRILLEKEIRITKKRVQTLDAHNISLRKEEVIIENITPVNKQDQQLQNQDL